jgi:hypothetical protein
MAVLTHAQLEALWVTAGGSNATADTAAAIAQAESGGNTAAILNTAYPNLPGYRPPSAGALPEYSVGLWQINELAHPQYTTTTLLSEIGNANAAVAISNGGASFSAWSTFQNGAYRQFLTSGGTPTPQPGTVTGTAGTGELAHAYSGWADLRQSVNHHLPNRLEHSRRARVATLQTLAHRHKVRG